MNLLREIVESYVMTQNDKESKCVGQKGIPIGNLTSQIFANIYLNEFDRFIKHCLKIKKHLRYGDDFIIITDNLNQLKNWRNSSVEFLQKKCQLDINKKNDILIIAKWGLKFLGTIIFPQGRKLNKRNLVRTEERLSFKNISSYHGLIKKHCKVKDIKKFNWQVLDYYEKQF